MKCLLGLTLALVLASTAVAAAKTVIYSGAHGGDFPSKPEKLKYSDAETGGEGSVTIKDLDWKNWGSDKATSPAKVKICSEAAGCYTSSSEGMVKAKKREELDTIGYYRKLVVYFGQNRIKFSLPTP